MEVVTLQNAKVILLMILQEEFKTSFPDSTLFEVHQDDDNMFFANLLHPTTKSVLSTGNHEKKKKNAMSSACYVYLKSSKPRLKERELMFEELEDDVTEKLEELSLLPQSLDSNPFFTLKETKAGLYSDEKEMSFFLYALRVGKNPPCLGLLLHIDLAEHPNVTGPISLWEFETPIECQLLFVGERFLNTAELRQLVSFHVLLNTRDPSMEMESAMKVFTEMETGGVFVPLDGVKRDIDWEMVRMPPTKFTNPNKYSWEEWIDIVKDDGDVDEKKCERFLDHFDLCVVNSVKEEAIYYVIPSSSNDDDDDEGDEKRDQEKSSVFKEIASFEKGRKENLWTFPKREEEYVSIQSPASPSFHELQRWIAPNSHVDRKYLPIQVVKYVHPIACRFMTMRKQSHFVPVFFHELDLALKIDYIGRLDLFESLELPREHLVLALTPRVVCSKKNMEALEFCGDAVLKFLTSLYVFFEYPDAEAGMLTSKKMEYIGNDFLLSLSQKSGMDRHLPKTGLVESIRNSCVMIKLDRESEVQRRKGKVIADMMESLIGAVFCSHGIRGAALCLERMGIPSPLKYLDSSENTRAYASSSTPLDELLEEKLHKLVEKMFPTYRFNQISLFGEAMTHGSCKMFVPFNSYERLEFLGDAVIDMIFILKHAVPVVHSGNPKIPGELTQLKQASVKNSHLKKISEEMGIMENAFALKTGGMRKPHADILEALAGAVFLDSSMNFEAVESVFPGNLFLSPSFVDVDVDTK
jgi:dsRNA-specific ribonuclease